MNPTHTSALDLLRRFFYVSAIFYSFSQSFSAEICWSETFDDPGSPERWSADNGVWQIGLPASGPGSGHDSLRCAGTNLEGDYPPQTDSRFISEEIDLCAVSGVERLQLRFWEWYSYNEGVWTDGSELDQGTVQVQVFDGTEWGPWQFLQVSAQEWSSSDWSKIGVDLTPLAGKKVRIGFYHEEVDNPNTGIDGQAPGWYIDDIEIWKGVLTFSESFEDGWGDWYTDRGVWQAGPPTYGPSEAYNGEGLVGTDLSADYPPQSDSILISPEVVLPILGDCPSLTLRFWQWYSYNNGVWTYGSEVDQGSVLIQAWEGSTWGDWQTVLVSAQENGSSDWAQVGVDLSSHAGNRVRIGFYHEEVDNPNTGLDQQAAGWYLDEIRIEYDSIEDIADYYAFTELEPLLFMVEACGPDLIYSLASDAPDGASIDPVTGQFSWTPSEVQGPGVYSITVQVDQKGSTLHPLDHETFNVEVLEVNHPPVFTSAGSGWIVEHSAGTAIGLSAYDPDNGNILNEVFISTARFNDLTLGDWSACSLASDKDWINEDFGDRYAWIHGFGGDEASDDWLISPALNLDEYTGETLSFLSQREFDGPDLSVLVSGDYSGNCEDIETATWTELSPSLPKADGNPPGNWTESGLLDLSAFEGDQVYIAFRYISDGTGTGEARLWRVDEIEVKGKPNELPIQELTYSLVDPPEGAAIDPITGVLTWNASPDQVGVHEITVRVTDDGNPILSTEALIEIEVVSPPYPWADLPDYGNNWKLADWPLSWVYSPFNDFYWPWMIDLELGWVSFYPAVSLDNTFSWYLYSPNLETWMWFSANSVPFLYVYGELDGWYQYIPFTRDPFAPVE